MDEKILEVWKDVVGYEGLYQVSSFGRIKSLVGFNGHEYVTREKLLKLTHLRQGYPNLCLCKDLNHHFFDVHRLVAQAFILNPQSLPCINHKDETRDNNHVDNLEWCTQQYNINYGTANQRRAETLSIPVVQKTKSGETVNIHKSARQAERDTGINQSNITKCVSGEYKSAGGYCWERVVVLEENKEVRKW